MIFGIGLAVFGYAVFYWGVHHFPGWDCNACPPKNDCCRYSLLDLLGVPKNWNFTKYPAVGLTPGQRQQAGDTGTQQQNPENQKTPSALGPNNSGWVNSILQGISAPTSFNNQNKLAAWNNCEGNLAGHSGTGINNPFNTTLPCCGSTGAVNSAGVQAYPTMTAGIQATVQTLLNTGGGLTYKAIVSNLVNDGDFGTFANAVGASPWGTDGSCIAKSGS